MKSCSALELVDAKIEKRSRHGKSVCIYAGDATEEKYGRQSHYSQSIVPRWNKDLQLTGLIWPNNAASLHVKGIVHQRRGRTIHQAAVHTMSLCPLNCGKNVIRWSEIPSSNERPLCSNHAIAAYAAFSDSLLRVESLRREASGKPEVLTWEVMLVVGDQEQASFSAVSGPRAKTDISQIQEANLAGSEVTRYCQSLMTGCMDTEAGPKRTEPVMERTPGELWCCASLTKNCCVRAGMSDSGGDTRSPHGRCEVPL